MTPPRAAIACLLLVAVCFLPSALGADGRECGDLAGCLRPLAGDVARALDDETWDLESFSLRREPLRCASAPPGRSLRG